MKKTILTLVTLIAAATTANASETICKTDRAYMRNAGKTEAIISFRFSETELRDGSLELSNFKGYFKLPLYLQTTFKDAGEDVVVLKFAHKELQSNPNYRPIKFKGSWQFKDIEYQSTNSVAPIWLNLVIPPHEAGEDYFANLLITEDQNGGKALLTCKTFN